MTAPPRALLNLGLVLLGWVSIRIVLTAYPLSRAIAPDDREWSGHPRKSESLDEMVVVQSYIAHQSRTVRIAPIGRETALRRKAGATLANSSGDADLHATIPEPATAFQSQSGVVPPVSREPFGRNAPENEWSLSAWSVYRPDEGSPGIAPNGQLGGSQIGFRVQRRLFETGEHFSASLNFRGSSPISTRGGQEAAFGISAKRIGKLPVEAVLERRVAIGNGGRNAFAAFAATGINDVQLPISFSLNGYAQAGVVGLKALDGFADGSLRIERRALSLNAASIHLGGGVWAAAQPGLSRVDVGPSASVRFRSGDASLRLSAEWRQRIAGNAAPGSGPAITLGLDY